MKCDLRATIAFGTISLFTRARRSYFAAMLRRFRSSERRHANEITGDGLSHIQRSGSGSEHSKLFRDGEKTLATNVPTELKKICNAKQSHRLDGKAISYA